MPSVAAPRAFDIESPCEWMRIFAVRLAQRRPEVSAEEIVRVAIDEFRSSGHLPPEHVAAIR